MAKFTLGGDRLGSGNKTKVQTHGFERSTHDLSYIWRSSMAPGVLVPFLNMVTLPGDTIDIDLEAVANTLPTVGPLFGSFKFQLDVFSVPVRLYQAQLHNNKTKIGLNMEKVKLPQIRIEAPKLQKQNINQEAFDLQQINPSSILAYLGIRGLGGNAINTDLNRKITREYNAIPLLAYWDIYKNYYSFKPSEKGAYINVWSPQIVSSVTISIYENRTKIRTYTVTDNDQFNLTNGMYIDIGNAGTNTTQLWIKYRGQDTPGWKSIAQIIADGKLLRDYNRDGFWVFVGLESGAMFNDMTTTTQSYQAEPYVEMFDLKNLDNMREDILEKIKQTTPFIIDKNTYAPYGSPLKQTEAINKINAYFAMNGLGLKTYQSDIFNNWLNTEWLENSEGTGINDITKVDTSDGGFTIDSLRLANDVNKMLNNIAVSGGTYDEWQLVVYGHEGIQRAETPIYMGGLSKEIVFQEVISNSASIAGTEEEPLGSLAGKGRFSGKNKGGKVVIKTNEISVIIGIASLTPRIDYSQGNDWAVNLKTMNDYHKPDLDRIGFQDLDISLMAAQTQREDGVVMSAGKQPAWINYMTNFNKVYGNFADPNKEMYMTLNRRYEYQEIDPNGALGIRDLTTYIDPSKYNYIFAQTELSAQNFWIQIGVDITARRKMSAKVMPSL